ANRRFCKDLALQPAPHGQGYQLDLFEAEAVDLALRLNWRIDTALRYQRSAARASLRLPRLWAGFAADAAAEVRGDGPELAALAARFDLPADSLMAKFRRERSGQTLYPLDWVSHQAQQAATVWAELAGFPQRQVFGLNRSGSQLVGYAGAAAFDFSERETRRQTPTRGCTAVVAAG
ncbi:MAG TPA: hypothetical protein PJ982_08800, partial [Lacipirellulaceae bacterium]|nr:hypothetical protein [Lacipirellulaceae bacterium]